MMHSDLYVTFSPKTCYFVMIKYTPCVLRVKRSSTLAFAHSKDYVESAGSTDIRSLLSNDDNPRTLSCRPISRIRSMLGPAHDTKHAMYQILKVSDIKSHGPSIKSLGPLIKSICMRSPMDEIVVYVASREFFPCCGAVVCLNTISNWNVYDVIFADF